MKQDTNEIKQDFFYTVRKQQKNHTLFVRISLLINNNIVYIIVIVFSFKIVPVSQ